MRPDEIGTVDEAPRTPVVASRDPEHAEQFAEEHRIEGRREDLERFEDLELGIAVVARAFEQGGYEPTFGTSRVDAGAGEELFARLADRLREREELSA